MSYPTGLFFVTEFNYRRAGMILLFAAKEKIPEKKDNGTDMSSMNPQYYYIARTD